PPYWTGKHLAARFDPRRGQAGQSSDLDAIRAVRRARLQAMQEHDLLARLAYRDVEVAERRKLLGQLRELVIVRREHRLAADPFVQVLCHGPGDRYAVVRRRSTPNLVEQHQAAGRGRVENAARFA